MALRKPPPKGECRQCWTHAYDPSIHKRLKPGQDCQECINCAATGHAGKIAT